MSPTPRFRSVVFDCDSTLSTIEGVDELARRKGIDVARLTADAMAGLVPLNEVYGARLQQIAPTTDDLIWLADLYARTVVPGAREVVGALTDLGIECHVISGGLLPAVQPFALSLGFVFAFIPSLSKYLRSRYGEQYDEWEAPAPPGPPDSSASPRCSSSPVARTTHAPLPTPKASRLGPEPRRRPPSSG